MDARSRLLLALAPLVASFEPDEFVSAVREISSLGARPSNELKNLFHAVNTKDAERITLALLLGGRTDGEGSDRAADGATGLIFTLCAVAGVNGRFLVSTPVDLLLQAWDTLGIEDAVRSIIMEMLDTVVEYTGIGSDDFFDADNPVLRAKIEIDGDQDVRTNLHKLATRNFIAADVI